MFYSGDLQSGISKAMQEAKLVACFVTDNLEESQLWQQDFLQEESLKAALLEQSVLLRIEAGSQEAAYLAAIFPLPKNPTLVVIKNGQLKEYIAAGVSKEEFTRRLAKALGARDVPVPQEPLASSSTVSTSAPPPATQAETSNTSVPQEVLASSSTIRTPAPPPAAQAERSNTSSDARPESSYPSENIAQQSSAVQNLLAERAARLEAHKKEQEAKEKAKRRAEAQARQDALDQAASSESASASSANMKYALMQKKRQQEAREERARILKRVEDDKAERRDRESARKAEAKAQLEGQTPSSSTAPSSRRPTSAECALQVRLFDGSTVRSRFSSQSNLRKDVRPWVDQNQPGDAPYTFKLVLSPLPNKNIETSEEERSLQSLGLTPSATLIIVPVSGYTSAYEGSPGYISRGVSAGYGLVSGAVGIVTGVLGSFLGGGGGQAHQENFRSTATTPNPSANVRTLSNQDERRRDDQQFYNGNALNFEPRGEDDVKKDD